jgi:hypothetical protein
MIVKRTGTRRKNCPLVLSVKNQNCSFFHVALFHPFSGHGFRLSQSFMITPRHTTLGRTPLDEWSARRRDLYLTTYKNHKRQTSMPPTGFEPASPANERPQTHALDCAATEIGTTIIRPDKYNCKIYVTRHRQGVSISKVVDYKLKARSLIPETYWRFFPSNFPTCSADQVSFLRNRYSGFFDRIKQPERKTWPLILI